MSGALAAHIRGLIAGAGPISVARYMALALGHPEHGYYQRGDPLGVAGDFITAPEISQIFGEIIGLWCAVTWKQMGAPDPVRLVELGPGRGTLMADALRAIARAAPALATAVELHLVENSPALRKLQERTLGAAGGRWHAAFETVPDGPLLLVANEFFDALPIVQYQRGEDGWRERLVDIDPAAEAGFRFVLSEDRTSLMTDDGPVGGIVETCPQGLALAGALGARLRRHGGAALIVDYGYGEGAAGDSLQAVRRHAPHDVLHDPGEADITAHVDFAALADAARRGGARVFGPVTQRAFLTRLGLAERAARLARTATPAQAREITAGTRRLIDRKEMGTLFKVLALAGPEQPPPPAFEPHSPEPHMP